MYDDIRGLIPCFRSVEAAGDIELPSGAYGLQARQGVHDFRLKMRK